MSFLKSISTIFDAINKHPLAGRHRVRAKSRFLKWQLSQILFPGIKKVSFAGGTCLLAKKGMTGATGNIYCGLHEFEDMAFLLHLLRPGDLFADVGANIGSYTVLASGVCKAKSISFEPVPSTFSQLEDNIRVNNIADLVQLQNLAVGAEPGKINFTSGLDTVNHVLSGKEAADIDFIEVPVVPLDNILKDPEVPLLIKIDAEGFETEVINGMSAVLQNTGLKAIIIELNGSGWHYGHDEQHIHDKLISHDFSPYAYDPFPRALTPLQTYGSHNTIYLRGIDFIKERIAAAARISVLSETF